MTTIAAPVQNQQPSKLKPTLAIIYKQLFFWLKKVENGGEIDKETGKRWIYKSNKEMLEEIQKLYPHIQISLSTIQRAMKRLCEMGLILRDQRKRSRCWHVCWYSLPETADLIPLPPDLSPEMPCGPDASAGEAQIRSTTGSTNKRRSGAGFGGSIRPKGINRKSGFGGSTRAEGGFPIQEAPNQRVKVGNYWVIDDGMFPSYA